MDNNRRSAEDLDRSQQQQYQEQDQFASPDRAANDRRRGFYANHANQSSTSIFEDVEMAHDEVGSSSLITCDPTPNRRSHF